MKVYVLQISYDYEGSNVRAIYSNLHDALEDITNAESPGPTGTWEVEEWELDNPECGETMAYRGYRQKLWVNPKISPQYVQNKDSE
jgi:hypothetical protein